MKHRVLIWVLLGALLIAHELYFFGYTVDEAYISARYARNLKDGMGLVLNPSERVEGYTNFLLVVSQALVPHRGESAMLFTKGLCMACSLVSLWLLTGLALRHHGSLLGATLGGLLFVVNGAVAVSAVTGLETHLFCVLVTGGCVAYLRGERRRELLSASLFAVSCLVRPEGFLFSAVTLLHLWVRDRRRAVRWVCLWTSLVLPLVLWRRAYYGAWVPNTFFAKTGGGLHQVSRGAGYLKSFLNEYGRIGLFSLAVLPFLRARIDWRRSYQLAVLSPYLVYVAYTGGDWIPHFRLIVPILPLLFSLLGEGISIVVRPVLAGHGAWRPARASVLVALLGLLVFDVGNQSYYLHMGTDLWAKGYRHAHRFMGDWLREEAAQKGAVALMDIGIVSYFSHRNVVDITGLTEPWIARAEGGWLKKSYPVAHLLDLEPAYIILVSRGKLPEEGFSSSFPIDQRIFDDPGFRESYEFLFARDAFYAKEPHDFGYYLNLFERKQ